MILPTHDISRTTPKEVSAVSKDVEFSSSRFPDYKLGANYEVLEEDESKVVPLRDVVAREIALLLEQQKRLSVRKLADKFDKELADAAKLSEESRLKAVTSLDKHVVLKKLRDVLEAVRGLVTNQIKDVEDAISMVDALAVQFTAREGNLTREKTQMKELADFLKQASQDAKKLIDEERAFASNEIERARAAVQRVEDALKEDERLSQESGKEEIAELMEEVQQARRIKMLHHPSKVLDMHYELRALRIQHEEKSKYAIQLKKRLAMSRKGEQNPQLYEFDGLEALGSNLQIVPCSNNATEICQCSVQWYRTLSEGGQRNLISGAISSGYAPEPFDVHRLLQADILFDGQRITLTTTGPIEDAPGLGSYVDALVQNDDTTFKVLIKQTNGVVVATETIHSLHINKTRIKVKKGMRTIVKENYSDLMQLCGVRGGGNAAPQAVFLQVQPDNSFVLAFETARDRNAAIIIARRFAYEFNINLAGPDDLAPPSERIKKSQAVAKM